VQKTYYPKPEDITRDWYVVDAAGKNLGRLATQIARALMGKDKPTYTPGVDAGDFVVKIVLRDQLKRFPDRVIRSAVWGMLPHNRLGRRQIKKLKVYAGSEHPHQAQKPKPLPLD